MIQWVASAAYPGIKVRGHALLWSKRGNNPEWVQVKELGLALPQELYGEDLVTAMTNRVNFTVSHYGSSRYVATPVAHWDVINEMVNQGTVSHEFYMEHTGDPLIRWQ